MRPVYNPEQEELYEIRPDTVADIGRGISSTRMVGEPTARLQFRYQDRVVTADVYASPEEVMVHWACPRCGHFSRISSTRKDVHWDGRKLSVAPFECAWELDNEREEKGPQASGLVSSGNLCRLRLAIDDNVLRAA